MLLNDSGEKNSLTFIMGFPAAKGGSSGLTRPRSTLLLSSPDAEEAGEPKTWQYCPLKFREDSSSEGSISRQE